MARFIVCALYHEARHRQISMTTLVNHLLTVALQGGTGWQKAQTQLAAQDHSLNNPTAPR